VRLAVEIEAERGSWRRELGEFRRAGRSTGELSDARERERWARPGRVAVGRWDARRRRSLEVAGLLKNPGAVAVEKINRGGVGIGLATRYFLF
jgi:hypothetical protein